MKIIETTNTPDGSPLETFLPIPWVNEQEAQAIADAINNSQPVYFHRRWRIVPDDYILQD